MKNIIEKNYKLLSAYMTHSKLVVDEKKSDDYDWARNEFHDFINRKPLDGLILIVELLKRCDDKKMLAYIAAGPLEEIMVFNGKEIITNLKKIADKDIQIQLALSGVWLDEDDEVYLDWKNMMKEYGFLGDNPREAL